MGTLEKLRIAFARAIGSQPKQSYSPGIGRGTITNVQNILLREQRRSAKLMRDWSRRNEFVRVAINRRKHQIGLAKWQVVRIDDPLANPDPSVQDAVRELFAVVNPKGESFRALLDQVIEDVLVLDAGCIWKRKTFGGEIHALYAVDGATIAPDPGWDGEDPKAIRYRQMIGGVETAAMTNDELVYVMANPTTHSPIGWSPVETLMATIEAELYGEQYDRDMLEQYAPEGFLYLGECTDQQREAFANYYDAEVAGLKRLGVLNGKTKPEFIPTKADTYETRQAYKKWLATKIAAVFEMDLLCFNLSETVHKSVGNSLTSRTDEGANALATLIAEYITREIVWEIDPQHRHGFIFDDLNARDELAQAKIDQIYMQIGVTYPDEVRARQGKDPVPWGEVPYVSSQTGFAGDDPGTGDDTSGDGNGTDDASNAKKAVAMREAPFVATLPASGTTAPTATPRLRYLDG